jgi:predicted DNA-binding transcriptional regulator AlpA
MPANKPAKPTAHDDEWMLDLGQVLERFPVSVPTLHKYIQEGKFPTPKSVKGRNLWVASEVTAALRALPSKRMREATPVTITPATLIKTR